MSPLMIELTEVAGTATANGTIQLTAAPSRKALVEFTEETLSAIRDSVAKVCRVASVAFEEANRPDEIVPKFGLKMGAKAGPSSGS
jgi:hypothetical protein